MAARSLHHQQGAGDDDVCVDTWWAGPAGVPLTGPGIPRRPCCRSSRCAQSTQSAVCAAAHCLRLGPCLASRRPSSSLIPHQPLTHDGRCQPTHALRSSSNDKGLLQQMKLMLRLVLLSAHAPGPMRAARKGQTACCSQRSALPVAQTVSNTVESEQHGLSFQPWLVKP